MNEFDVWMCVDSAGDYAVGTDECSAREAYEKSIQPLADCDGFRLVKLSVTMPLPVPIEIAVDVPEVDETAKDTVR